MGGHGDHGGHHAPYTVPKAETYKIENATQVMETQKHLARRGLKDPWARYFEGPRKPDNNNTQSKTIFSVCVSNMRFDSKNPTSTCEETKCGATMSNSGARMAAVWPSLCCAVCRLALHWPLAQLPSRWPSVWAAAERMDTTITVTIRRNKEERTAKTTRNI